MQPVSNVHRNLRKYFFVCLAVVVTGACSSGSLPDPYKGTWDELMPKQVGNYKMDDFQAMDNQRKASGVIGGVQANYKLPDGKTVFFSVINFYSADAAKEHLHMLEQREWSGRTLLKSTDGPKKKGWSQVGDRVEVTEDVPGKKKVSIVLWTNGSVMFMASNVRMEQNAGDVLDFESIYPY